MFTKSDKKFLKDNFVTKDDLVAMENRQDKKFKSVNSKLKNIKGSLEVAIDVFDRQGLYHHKRLATLEKKAGIEKQPYPPTIN